MLVVLGLVPIVIIIAIVSPIVAIAKQQEVQAGYTFTACVAAWYAQIMAMVGIVVFTMGIGYLFKSLIGYLLISSPDNQSRVPFGEMLGFALAFMGAFVAHMVIWRRYPGGSWWAPPDVWPPAHKVPEKAQI